MDDGYIKSDTAALQNGVVKALVSPIQTIGWRCLVDELPANQDRPG